MSETIITKSEEAADGTATDLAQDLGHVQADTEHHAEQIEKHEEQLENIEEDKKWTDQRLDNLATELASVPRVSMEEIRTLVQGEMQILREELKPKETSIESSQTQTPPQTQNEPKKKRGVLGLLHRLL